MIYYYSFLALFVSGVIAYCIGSIPFSLLISKCIYKIDIREVGSHNAGGTNVGRIIGKKAAILVISLDIIKMLISCWIVYFTIEFGLKNYLYDFAFLGKQHYTIYTYFAGLCCAIGHSFPLFADFKGGKSVAVFFGFMLATNIYLLIITVSVFFIIFAKKRIVSISSILTVCVTTLTTLVLAILNYIVPNNIFLGGFVFTKNHYLSPDLFLFVIMLVFALLVVFRHRQNIIRLRKHTEPITHYRKKEDNAK